MAEKEWGKLTHYQHIRRNTEMYFGPRDGLTQRVLEYGTEGASCVEATWTPAAFTAFREILDNALDEIAAKGFGDRIDVTFDPTTMTFSVADNGRGIPINWDDEEKDYAATVLLSHPMSGRNFIEDRGDTTGVNGIGAKGTNFTSAYMEVEINRDSMNFKQRFTEGAELTTSDAVITRIKGKKTGTKISFKLSSEVFKSIILTSRFIESRIYEVALCYPAIKFFFNGEHIKIKSVEQSISPTIKPITFTIDQPGFNSRFWLFPQFLKDGSEYTHGTVNAIPMFQGGVHIDAFQKAFYSDLLAALERESKKRKLLPNRSDVADGMLLYNITQMAAPTFDSQAKTRMGKIAVAGMVRKHLEAPEFFKRVIKQYPEWIEAIYEKCAARTMKKDQKDLDREAKKAKREKVEDLEDACSHDRSKCILFLCEGKSAVAGLTEARNPEIHGGLPLRGKIMNVYGMTPAQAMRNETLKHICNAIGLVPGTRANRHMLRYGMVNLTMDADHDGSAIAGQLVNFFYTFWPELFDPDKPPFIYRFDTPLIIAVKGKKRSYFYEDDYETFNSDDFKGWEITRAKGLAALKRDDWIYALANPRSIPIYDDGNLAEALDLIFSKTRADDRKIWLEEKCQDS